MIHFLPNNPETEALIVAGSNLIKDPVNWCKGYMQNGNAFCINGAMFEVGTPDPDMPVEYTSEDTQIYRGDLARGQIPEPFWFLRQSVKFLTMNEFDNVGEFNDAPETAHNDIIGAMNFAVYLVQTEMEKGNNPVADFIANWG